jgi:hypothetical protein
MNAITQSNHSTNIEIAIWMHGAVSPLMRFSAMARPKALFCLSIGGTLVTKATVEWCRKRHALRHRLSINETAFYILDSTSQNCLYLLRHSRKERRGRPCCVSYVPTPIDHNNAAIRDSRRLPACAPIAELAKIVYWQRGADREASGSFRHRQIRIYPIH